MDEEFVNLKNEIANLRNLRIPDYKKELILRTDASNLGLGAVLM